MDTDSSSVLDWPLYCSKRGIIFVSKFLVACVMYVSRLYLILKLFLCVITHKGTIRLFSCNILTWLFSCNIPSCPFKVI